MGKDTITLASGREMPLVGFGLWKVPRETCADTVYNVSFTQVLSSVHKYLCSLIRENVSN